MSERRPNSNLPPAMHGRPQRRGSALVPRSRAYGGPYGRMFRNLPPADFGDEDDAKKALVDLAKRMIAPPVEMPSAKRPESKSSREQNSDIPAGYTYFGQFVDHDLTFDPATSLERDNDPDALEDYRTPQFDLDSLYGRGPADQPYLYLPDNVRFVFGRQLRNTQDKNVPLGWDVPRLAKRAIIGDPRNSENVIITQVHSLFMRFHNHWASKLQREKGEPPDFQTVQQMVRWHYQWVILHDFLPKIVDEDTYEDILPNIRYGTSIFTDKPRLRFYEPKYFAFMPVEFSAAAYRFGHSMVRPFYQLNQGANFQNSGPFRPPTAKARFNRELHALTGFVKTWVVDWDLFFPNQVSPDLCQFARRIDTSIEDPLSQLPFAEDKDFPSLPARNLLRGWRLGLPAGERVAEAMDVPREQRIVPKVKVLRGKSIKLETLGRPFTNNTPLWFYVLAEAQELHDGNRLGPVGSRIILETVVGMLLADGYSYLQQYPSWQPDAVLAGGKFGMRQLIDEAQKYKPPLNAVT